MKKHGGRFLKTIDRVTEYWYLKNNLGFFAEVRVGERVNFHLSIITENDLKILSSNVRGLISNWDAIKTIDWGEYDIMAFNEIWAVNDFETLKVDGFEIKTIKTRANRRGGGVVMFAKNNLKTEILETNFIDGTFESVGIKVGSTVIVNIYRPPSGNKQTFMEELNSLLEIHNGKDIILMGDFNINFLERNNDWENFCNQFGIKNKISNITRIASGTCIDNFVTNLEGIFSVTNLSIADHLAIKAKIKLKCKIKRVKSQHSYRAMKDINWLLFKNGIHNLEIDNASINNKWDSLSQKIKEVVEQSFPLKMSRHEYHFSMSKGLIKSRDKKNKLLRDYKAGKINKNIYVNYNKIYRKLIQIEQEKSFKNQLISAGNDGKKKWKVIKQGLLLEKENKKITELVIDGHKIENNQIIANKFKTHFETCALSLADNLPPSRDTCNIMEDGNNWSFSTVSEADIVKIISSLKNKNSCGPDLLSNRMIKAEKYAFAKLLKPLINESIEKGIFPESLKSAIVIPIFKKGNCLNMNNYRPISLLPVMSKVFEKVLNQQLTNIIENGFIDDNQFGFRKSHSTEDALMRFADRVQKELAANKHVVSVFVDVSKAFDSCDHNILIKKIKKTGLDEVGIKLIESYLKDRKQNVFVNGIFGGSFVINIGVGQGTILGPTFFKIYIMDLHLHTNLFTIKFADDSNFIGTGNTRYAVELLVNTELEKVSDWFTSNRLTLHPGKSKFLVHSRDKLIDLKLNGISLQRSGYGLQEESVKMLGIEIDENLDWRCHTQSVVKKISKGNYLLWRYKSKLSDNLKKIINESFVRCHILYGITIWGGASAQVLKPVEKMLAKIWSKFGKKKLHTLTRLKNHGLLKLSDELSIQESKIIWKWDKKKIPKSLMDIISERVDNLRGRRFNINRNYKTGNISYRLAKRANNFISIISPPKTKKSLAKKLRKEILSSYVYNCRQRNCFICVPRNN